MYSRRRDICRAESAPSMWSLASVKIQIENHLANLPVVRSVNKFRFTRVGGLHVMDTREARRFNLHKSGRERTLAIYAREEGNLRGIFCGIGTDLFIARSSGSPRAEYTVVQFVEPEVTCARMLIKTRRRDEIFEIRIGGFHMSRLRYVIYALLTSRWSI